MGPIYATDEQDRRPEGSMWPRKDPHAIAFTSRAGSITIDPIYSTNRSNNVKTKKIALPMGENFASCYMELCKQQRVRPLPLICVTLPDSLDLTTDRVRTDDWGPILNSLSLDRSLKSVSVRSCYQYRKSTEEINSEEKAKNMVMKHKEPVFLTRYLLEWLSHSVAQCLRNSRALTCLALEGVPFSADCLAALCVGLASTVSLRRLSLRRCCISENGCELVCRTVADLRTLRSFDLSECDLAENCVSGLAAALSRQNLSLYDETWKESLRYREPNLKAMPGLRRLTLNGNPRLGDRGISELIEAVRDSLWLKALDLQHCGLTDFCGHEIIRLLEHNTTLAIVDVRMNIHLSDDMLRQIFQRLDANGANITANGKPAYIWMSLSRKYRRSTCANGRVRSDRYENISTRTNDFRKGKSKTAIPYHRVLNPEATASLPYPVTASAPSITVTTTNNRKNKNNNKNDNVNQLKLDNEKSTTKLQPKISVRLDLKSSIESTTSRTIARAEQSNDKEIKLDNVATEGGVERSNQVKSIQEGESRGKRTKVNGILLKLSEARMEQDGLEQKTKKTDILLAEEKIRRQTAESKLRKIKEKLWDLEMKLKNKKWETRGFLLISQRSLEDIATSFDKLLQTLENTTSPPLIHAMRCTKDEYLVAKSEIRTRVAHLIRKSKSESHGRLGFEVEHEQSGFRETLSTRHVEGDKKIARSEGDVTGSTTLQSITQPIRLERNIGDSPDMVLSRTRGTQPPFDYYESKCNEISDSCLPCGKARAIFTQIMNGDAILDLRSCDGS